MVFGAKTARLDQYPLLRVQRNVLLVLVVQSLTLNETCVYSALLDISLPRMPSAKSVLLVQFQFQLVLVVVIPVQLATKRALTTPGANRVNRELFLVMDRIVRPVFQVLRLQTLEQEHVYHVLLVMVIHLTPLYVDLVMQGFPQVSEKRAHLVYLDMYPCEAALAFLALQVMVILIMSTRLQFVLLALVARVQMLVENV